MKKRPLLVVSCMSLALTAVSGCGGSTDRDSAPVPMPRMVEDFRDLLADHQKQSKDKAPSDLGDVSQEVLNNHDTALWLLNNKKIVYVWGAPLKPGGQAVIAYVTEAPQSGGEVLIEDGTVKAMTAAEFAAAPKAAGTAKK